MTQKPQLTISILISNRPDTVKKCLDSVQHLLDTVPSELILTDTGCGKEVRSIIEQYTEHIIDFTWCKDFAKARNAGLRQARGEWFLFLDDDEWFESTAEIESFFCTGEYRKYGLGGYIQRNYLDKSGTVYSDLPVARMIRLEKGIEFIYSIHEVFNRVPGEVKMFRDYVHHYGYAYATREEKIAHTMRNVELLLVENEKAPGNMKHAVQLAQEYNVLEDWEKSRELSERTIAYAKKHPIEVAFCRDSLYCNVVQTLQRQNRVDEEIETGERYLREEKIDPLAQAMLYGLLAVAYVRSGKPEQALQCAEQYVRRYRDYCSAPDSFLGYVTTINSACFEQGNRGDVIGSGIAAAAQLGRVWGTAEWQPYLEIEKNGSYVNKRMVQELLKALYRTQGKQDGVSEPAAGREQSENSERTADQIKASESAVVRTLCGQLAARAEIAAYMAEQILQLCTKPQELSAFAGIGTGHWVLCLADLQGGKATAQMQQCVLAHFRESMPYITTEVLQQLMPEQLSYCEWKAALDRNVPALDETSFQMWGAWADRLPAAEELKKLAWSCAANIRVILRADKGETADAVEQALWSYAKVARQLCGKIYLPDILNQNRDVLPEEYQGAYLLAELHDKLEPDGAAAGDGLQQALLLVRKLQAMLPGMGAALKLLLARIQDRLRAAEQEKRQADDEMQRLGRQIKDKIQQMLAAGQREQAKNTAQQLYAMLPGDTELQMLLRELEA